MSFEVKGLNELAAKLNNIADRAKKLDGSHEVPLTDLLTPVFLSGCSRFGSVEEMFTASGFKIDSTEDFKAIPDDEWNIFIKNNTSFGDWQEMLGAAAKAWTTNQLGL